MHSGARVLVGTASFEAEPATAVVVAESEYLTRYGITSAIAEAEGLSLAGTADTVAELMSLLSEERVDVVVIGPRLERATRPEKISLCTRINRQQPTAGIVLLAGDRVDSTHELLQQPGAGRACLFESSITSAERLVHVVLEVAAGSLVLEQEALELMTGPASADHGLAALTSRERDVLALIALGANNAAIAARLVLTERAVERHINAIYRKLQLHERPDQHLRVAAALMYHGSAHAVGRPCGIEQARADVMSVAR